MRIEWRLTKHPGYRQREGEGEGRRQRCLAAAPAACAMAGRSVVLCQSHPDSLPALWVF